MFSKFLSTKSLRIVLIPFLAIFIFSCEKRIHYSQLNEKNDIHLYQDKPFTGIAYDHWDNDTLQLEIRFKDGKYNGETKWYWENGQLGRLTNYLDGEYHGEIIEYHENGDTHNIQNYKNGIRHGRFASYDENGILLTEYFYENGTEKKNSYSDCKERKQGEILSEHIILAAEMSSLFDKSLSEQEFNLHTSDLINKMYKNLCSGEVLTFTGKVGHISVKEQFIRIDDMLSTDKFDYLAIFESNLRSYQINDWVFQSGIEKDDLVLFKFQLNSFFHPSNRAKVVKLIKEGNAGSFPLDRMWDGVNDTFPEGEYFIFPIGIELIELNTLAELFNSDSQ